MRAGRLKYPADLLGENGVVIATQMIGISDADDSIPFEEGLLQSARITLRARYYTAITSGRYFRVADGRLFLVKGASDPDGRQQDLLISASEIRGQIATVNPGGVEVLARCALLEYSAKPSTGLLPTEQRRRAEFCNVEYRPSVGAEFIVGGARYRVTEIDPDGTTSVITRVWVSFLGYEEAAAA
jgi:hypothetical protein